MKASSLSVLLANTKQILSFSEKSVFHLSTFEQKVDAGDITHHIMCALVLLMVLTLFLQINLYLLRLNVFGEERKSG